MSTYSAHEVAELAGVTYRQIDYWCRLGVIYPRQTARGSGSRRRFSEDQVRALRVLGVASRFFRSFSLGVGLPSTLARMIVQEVTENPDASYLSVWMDGDRIQVRSDGDDPDGVPVFILPVFGLPTPADRADVTLAGV
jgi:hypothetical protein